MKRLSIRGGQTLKKTIWRVASKVFGPVAKQLNWCGRGDKRGLKNTNIGTLVIGMFNCLAMNGLDNTYKTELPVYLYSMITLYTHNMVISVL